MSTTLTGMRTNITVAYDALVVHGVKVVGAGVVVGVVVMVFISRSDGRDVGDKFVGDDIPVVSPGGEERACDRG